jgi:AcrR family transcriptional regulator
MKKVNSVGDLMMRKKDETKKVKIQDATAAIILKYGAAAVSTIKVAKKVGISQSNVYLYFKNKDDLLMSVYQRELAKIIATGDLTRISDATIPITERLRLYMKSIYDFALKNPESLTLIEQIKFLMGQSETNLLADQLNNNVVVSLLEEAMAANVIRSVPVNLVMAMVFAVVRADAMNQQSAGFDDFYHLIWNGIRATD